MTETRQPVSPNIPKTSHQHQHSVHMVKITNDGAPESLQPQNAGGVDGSNSTKQKIIN